MQASHTSYFNSRFLFYLWSRGGNEHSAIRENHQTILHGLWEKDNFYVKDKLSLSRILRSVAAYPVGMIGFLIDTALKVVLLVGNLLIYVISLFSCKPEWRAERRILFLDTLAAVGIGLIGIVVPPLAYELEKMAQENMFNSIGKNFVYYLTDSASEDN